MRAKQTVFYAAWLALDGQTGIRFVFGRHVIAFTARCADTLGCTGLTGWVVATENAVVLLIVVVTVKC